MAFWATFPRKCFSFSIWFVGEPRIELGPLGPKPSTLPLCYTPNVKIKQSLPNFKLRMRNGWKLRLHPNYLGQNNNIYFKKSDLIFNDQREYKMEVPVWCDYESSLFRSAFVVRWCTEFRSAYRIADVSLFLWKKGAFRPSSAIMVSTWRAQVNQAK